jgi:hypothetical protein
MEFAARKKRTLCERITEAQAARLAEDPDADPQLLEAADVRLALENAWRFID